jgi:hypothetical protein
VEAGQTATFEQAYSPLPASITVTLSPAAAVDSGARWRIVGTGEWRESGYTDSAFPIGDQAVEFSDVAGWVKPADKSLNVKPGQTVKLSAVYTKLNGSVAVTIDPEQAISAGARWRVKGVGQWRTSGYSLENLNPGGYTVEFKAIQGWDKPAEIPIQVVGGQAAVTSGTYVVQKGSLTVVIGPQAAIGAGAKWRRKVVGLWRESGTREQQVEPGTYLVEFTGVQGWAKPDDKQVVIRSGEHTSLSVVYAPLTGALKVTIRPQGAINDGAEWKLSGTDEWFDGDHTISSLPAGKHTIKFKNVQGWIKPDDIEVTVSGGKTATAAGRYKKPGETRDGK